MAAERGCEVDSDGEFISAPELVAFLDERVSAVMEQVSKPERVKKCLYLARPFQVEDEELTATLKVRRRHIIARYEGKLAGLYE